MPASLIARNRIQKLFLKEENTLRLNAHVAPLRSHEHQDGCRAVFEEGDWDIFTVANRNKCECDWSAKPDGSSCDCRYAKEEETFTEIYCSIQATVGDDYPTILRKMSKRVEKRDKQGVKERVEEINEAKRLGVPWPPTPTHYVLLVGELTTGEITREELSQLFAQKYIKVAFLDNLGLAPQ